MNEWDNWPKEVAPFSVASVYVEFKTSVVTKNDAGEVSYQLDGTPYAFEIQARGTSGFHLQVQLTNMSTLANALDSTIPIGWNHDGFVNWALAGSDPASFVSSNPPQTWIQNSLPVFGGVTLGRFVLPGSHDAGRPSAPTPRTVLTKTPRDVQARRQDIGLVGVQYSYANTIHWSPTSLWRPLLRRVRGLLHGIVSYSLVVTVGL